MTKEVIEIRDTDPNVDEQIAQILRPKRSKTTSACEKLIDFSDRNNAVERVVAP